MHNAATHREQVKLKSACHSERSGVSAANGTQSRNPVKQRVAWIAGFLDSATPSTLQQSAGLRSARNDTRFFQTVTLFCDLNNKSGAFDVARFVSRVLILALHERSRSL